MEATCFILHVKKGFEKREKSITEQFSMLDMPFEWILDHDKHEITYKVLQQYKYSGSLKKEAISCSLKHIKAWEMIAKKNCKGAFVFEDDVLINIKKFKKVTQKAFGEFNEKRKKFAYISLGSGCALYVPWTNKKKNKALYPAEHVRATDSYWITRQTAQKMVQWIEENGFWLPADHLIDRICTEMNIPILWLEPTIVNQGSHTGLFQSSIQNLERGRFTDKIGWKVKILRRKYLYPLMGIDLTKKD